MADGTERRELSVNFGSGAYILRYIVEEDDTLVILRMKHSREQRLEQK